MLFCLSFGKQRLSHFCRTGKKGEVLKKERRGAGPLETASFFVLSFLFGDRFRSRRQIALPCQEDAARLMEDCWSGTEH